MNPWGLVLVALGIIMIMIGATGQQHTILQTLKGIPASARGVPASQSQATNPPPTPGSTTPGSNVQTV